MSDLPREDGCVFCRIVAGELPCHKVYEDADVLAFLDIEPLSRGHVVVIPKGHWATLDRMPEDAAAAIGRCLPGLGRAVMGVVEGRDEGRAVRGAWNVLQNNGRAAHQAVDHVHFHIIPKPHAAPEQRSDEGAGTGTGLGISWPAGKLEEETGKALAERLREALNHGDSSRHADRCN